MIVPLLATLRLTRLAVEDEITRPIREKIEERWPDSQLNYLVGCEACSSVWAGLVVQVLPKPVLLALALSQGVLGVKWMAEVAEAKASGR